MTTNEQTISLTEAAEIIGRSTQFVVALVADGELTALPNNRFSLSEVRAYAGRPTVNTRRRVARC